MQNNNIQPTLTLIVVTLIILMSLTACSDNNQKHFDKYSPECVDYAFDNSKSMKEAKILVTKCK